MANQADTSSSLKISPPVTEPGFGAYGTAATHFDKAIDLSPGRLHANENIPGGVANDNPPQAKQSGSLDFTDSDKRWLKDIGITTSHPIDFQNVWSTNADRLKEQSLKWNETYKGRLAIRAISRGVIGTAAYAAAQMYAGVALENCKLHEDPKNILARIARIIDKTAGRSIQFVVKNMPGGTEEKAFKATMFRDTANHGNYYLGDTKNNLIPGRSLGHEAVAVTFDFATMSFADYMTRYVIGLFDPHAKNAWIKDGHLQPTGAMKDLFANIFRGITYAAGEDMAVAIPYVYYTRLQRNVINHFSPGFKYDADLGLNGGSFKLNDHNKVIGNYQLEGMLDLMGRFTVYNVGTKMFRDAYNVAESRVSDWWNHDSSREKKEADQPHVHHTLLQKVDNASRYVFRTSLKTMMYMIPSTFFFYITRAPQTKFRGIAIHPEKGVIGRYTSQDLSLSAEDNTNLANSFVRDKASWQPVRFTSNTEGEKAAYERHIEAQKAAGKEQDPPYRLLFRKNATDAPAAVYAHTTEDILNPFTGRAVDAYTSKPYNGAMGRNQPWHDVITNPFGRLCYTTGTVLSGILKPFGKLLGLNNPEMNAKSAEKFARTWVNASYSYTPYFMAKTDIGAAAWDNKRMDMGLDRLWHGVTRADIKDIAGGGSEVFHTVLYEPFSDPKREEKAQEKMLGDPEKRSNEAYQSAMQKGRHEKAATQESATASAYPDEATPSSRPAYRPTYNTLRKPGEPWADWLKPEALAKRKEQDAKSFSQDMNPRAASWTTSYSQQQDTVPLGQTVH